MLSLTMSGYPRRWITMKKRPALLSYRLRISLTMALFTLIPFAIMSVIFISAEKTKWEQTALTQYSHLLELSKEQLSRGFQEMENKMLYVKSDASIRNSLNKTQKMNLSEKLEFISELREVENAITVDSEALTLRWYSVYSDYTYGEYCYSMEDLIRSYGEGDPNLQRIHELGNNEMLTLLRRQPDEKGKDVVYVYAKIDNDNGVDHVLEMSMPIDAMLFTVQAELPENSFLGAQLVLGDQLRVVTLWGDDERAQERLEEYYRTGECPDYYPMEASLSKHPGSRITCLLQEDYVWQLTQGSMITLICIFVVLILMVLAGSYFTSRLLTRKVIHFIEHVNYELSDEEAKKNYEKYKGKDFTDIERKISELAYCSREYGKQLDAYEVEKKQMELELLQMRFNPHFLYNTLGSIRYQVKEERIRTSIDSLIAYYRIVLSKGSLFISIESEIRMIQEYLKLQTFAFDLRNVQYVYEIEEDVKEYIIVKHLLQPIVENALEHGVRGTDAEATITIRARLQDENVVFEVEDTGIGMTQEQIEQVTTEPARGFQLGGYGVYNVIQRIKAYYGQEYGVAFFSQPGKGTRVVITIPRMTDTAEEAF